MQIMLLFAVFQNKARSCLLQLDAVFALHNSMGGSAGLSSSSNLGYKYIYQVKKVSFSNSSFLSISIL